MLKQIGKYTISERIGRGTYSRIYRAVDAQGRPVAIKVSTTQTEPQHLDEFQKDLVTAASVLHPNLVAVHDLGFEDEFPYLVMELVEGQDLDKLLKTNAAPGLAERIRVMQQVAGALKAAHERGVYHLDIRPSKIMLGNDGEAKLLDLGLGRLSFDPARVTEHGYLVGAPFYMSPERLTAIDTADERCDIWSFGVTFYEWISGHHPFYDDDGDRMIGNIMDGTPAELANVPAQLNHTILRAIEKDPADRYQTFADLLVDLQPLLGDLKREESDALMAEALKQTDSGRWHEARRIARQMRDINGHEASPSQMFGLSDLEPERSEPERMRPAAAAAAAAAAVSIPTAMAATAVDTPEPAPAPVEQRPVQTVPITPPMAAAAPATTPVATPLTTPRGPQRPERTAPKIPVIGVRNGAASAETSTPPPTARVQPTPAAANGARIAANAAAAAAASAAASARPAVVREIDTAPRSESGRIDNLRPDPQPQRPEPIRSETARPEATRTRPRATVPPQAPAPTVRILEMDESSGFPWVKILGFAIPALLILGALFFFLRPGAKTKVNATPAVVDEANESGPAGRVIKTDGGTAASTPSPSGTTNITPTATTNATPAPDGTAAAAGTDPLNPSAPKSFDPKSLTNTKPLANAKKKLGAPMVGVAAPALTATGEATEASGLPMTLGGAPPPPAPVAPPTPAPVKASVTAVPQTQAAPPTQVQSVEAASEAASHIGGSFAKPVPLHQVAPIYPPAAMQRKTEGTVRFKATIAKDGSVKNIQLLSGNPLLNVAARQAVAQFKYRPAMLNGEAIEVTQEIIVDFKLTNR